MPVNVATLPITVGVGAFVVRNEELLVVRKTYGPSKGLWTIPSGYVEPGESIVQTVEREVKEETGIVGRAGHLLGVRNRVTEAANDTFLIFSMAHEQGEPQPDRVEVSEAAYVPLEQLKTSRESADFTRAIIPKLSRAPGLRLDSYKPPADSTSPRAYLLFV
jgi:8-oxo-dGTP diphosphatase